jgi:hypothetical protein
MIQGITVADYIIERLAQEGFTDCFGVAGDFAFKLNDAVVRSERIRWIGCQGWFTAKVTTLGELDAALARASAAKSACYIAVVGGKTDYPAGLAAAHQRLEALYADV